MSELNFSNVAKILGKKSERKLYVFSSLRVLANGLDIVGLAGIALLATAFGAFASGSGQAASVDLPLIGSLIVTETEAIVIALFIVVVFVSKSAFSILLNLKTALYVAKIERRLSRILADDFFQIQPDVEGDQTSISNFQTLSLQSVSGLKTFLNGRIQFLAEGSLLVSLLVVFLVVNPIAAVVLTAFMGGVLSLINMLINLRLRRNGQRLVESSQVALQSARDLHGIRREAHSGGVIRRWITRFDEARASIAHSQAIIFTLNSLPRFVIETSLILGVFMFIAGVVVFSDIPSQSATIGVFLAGGLRIMASIIPFQGAISAMRTGAASGQFAYEVLTEIAKRPRKDLDQTSLDMDLSATIRFDKVSFSYGASGHQVLKKVSLQINPGSMIAIVGPSGAGKSTLLDLAMGFLVPNEGEALVGEKTARAVLLDHPGTFALVPQRPYLISGSILENVSLEEETATDIPRVKELLGRVGLEKLTSTQGWEKLEIRPDSGQLSGGEMQRLSLARALYRRPKILFLDEATSSLDAANELEISKVLDNLKKDMTVVFIAHRLSTVRKADRIIYLKGGRIIAQGTFSELKAKVSDFSKAVEIMGLS